MIRAINILNGVLIDLNTYKPNAGWVVFTGIPYEKDGAPIQVQIKHPIIKEDGEWDVKTSTIEVKASMMLDEMLTELIAFLKELYDSPDTPTYLFDYYMDEISLDPNTMVATMSIGL